MDDEDRFNRRPLRLDCIFARPLYFVTFNTSERQSLLARAEVHDTFREFCLRNEEHYDVAVGRYVLMPDHVHLFVALPPEGITLSKWVQSLRTVRGNSSSRRLPEAALAGRIF
ncbi:MAG: transposase [Verrucomicrobiota bacterium]|nr:transposase [Verrucomicrobiota bacterium]